MIDTVSASDELVFLPLGGAGEIGMNLNLYGFGPPSRRQWIIVDCGVMFGNDETPGVDVIMPDPAYIAERRRDLLGIVLTHAHEDHIGAVAYLWPELKCPVYATPFTAALLRAKLEDEGLLGDVPLKIVPMGGRLALGPFDIEYVAITHSIPEPNALVIRTPLGRIVHTGDWKLDPDPLIGPITDEERLRAVGGEGVLACVCDSTNVFTPGHSGSEADVRASLSALVRTLKGRVAVTAFASNVARLESIAKAAEDAGRSVVLVGRSMHKVVGAAQENGMLQSIRLIDAAEAHHLAPEEVLYLATGSQGEPRAALARIAEGDHPHVRLGPGDTVLFSSRIIPGNERAIFAVQNRLAERGVEVLTEKDHFVHVSGHPCRDELAEMYRWVKPRLALPVHGELRHLVEHARLAEQLQVPQAIVAPNGTLVRLAPGAPMIADKVGAGRLHLDGNELVEADDSAVGARRSLAFAGFLGITLVLDERDRLVAPPAVMAEGIPETVAGLIRDAVGEAFRNQRRNRPDESELADMARRIARRAAQDEWGKKPMTKVQIVRV